MSLRLEDARASRKFGVVRFTSAQRSARWQAKHPEKVQAYRAGYKDRATVNSAKWRKCNPEKVADIFRRWEAKKGSLGFLLYRAKRGAKQRGLEFSIVAEDLLPLPSHCPVLGIELDYVGAIGRDPRALNRYNRASIDRKDSTKGYVSGNVLVVSWRANTLKSDATPDELRKLSDFYGRLS